MNSAAYTGMMRGNGRFAAGVGASLAVHLLLMFAYRHAGPLLPVFQPDPPTSIAVRILPPPPPRAPPRREQLQPPRAAAARPRNARRPAPKPVIAMPATPASPQPESAPDPFVVQQAPEPAAAPQFDMGAAKETARQLARQTKLGREGTAVAQFPDPPLETETKAARAISKAKRRNCKDGIPGGLLAPLYLMMDKKDSGCKW